MAGTAMDPLETPPRWGACVLRCARNAALPVLLAASLVYPTAFLLAWWDWHADVLTPFTLPAALFPLLALGVCVRRRRLWLTGPVLALALLQLSPLVWYRVPSPVRANPQRPERLRILVVNVLESNTNYEAVAALIRRERPDIVGLIEVTPAWIAGLAGLGVRDEFPHRLESPTGFDGLALWFRREGPRPELMMTQWEGNPVMTARFEWAGQPRRLWLVHPGNPLYVGANSLSEIKILGAQIAAQRRSEGAISTIVVGDMNRTDGSPHFGRFLKQTGLRDSRYGFGRQPSWPAWLPAFRIAIDHAFVSDDLAVTVRRLGPDVGSDHLPMILELAPAATKAATQSNQAAP